MTTERGPATLFIENSSSGDVQMVREYERNSITLFMENPLTGDKKIAPVGFSWTTLFFGFFIAAYRRDAIWAIIQFVLWVLTFAWSNLIFSFIYNKIYVKKLISKGYKVRRSEISEIEEKFIVSKIGIPLPIIEDT